MKQIIQFHVSQGEHYYVAEGADLPVVTQAKTLDQLALNVREAVDVQLKNEDPAEFGLAPHPSILLSLELASPIHA